MKKMFMRFALAIAFLVGNSFISIAQTVHAIIACNTIDSKIGTGMSSDMKNMRNAIQIIVSTLDCEYEEKVFDGPICTRENVTNYINNMDVERDDVIIFFYGGHGTHAMNNTNDPWPQMCMNTNIESLYMPVASVERLLSAKQPKLRIILTNCCNMEETGVSVKPLYAQSTGPTMQSDYNSAAFKKLFLDSKGKIMMTSSKLGQYSWCSNNGGLFTNYLLDVLDAVGMGKLNADWNTVCEMTHDKTLACNTLPGGAKQEPYYIVKTNDSTGENSNRGKDNNKGNTTNLFSALQILVTKNLSKDVRLGKISEIQMKYFSDDAHVITVGRNGTSKIMYEDVSDFLRRLALSDNIKQVNVIEGDNTGKNSLITVHEVRY
ncbi:MAG: caspase family protein [Prevotellaceae bacterium]|nr:caspase family protein [Prevotellaceae bacterium]